MERLSWLILECFVIIFNGFNGAKGGLYIYNASTLQFVSIISRHGHRSPLVTFPNDIYQPHDTKYWPDGVGQLTKLGKAQAYRIGLNLRSRYAGFIAPDYQRNESYFSSNLNDRDLMSAELVAAGLYPPKGGQIWNSSMPWQPVPIWPEPRDVDDVVSNRICPKYDYLRDRVYEREFGRLSDSDTEFMRRLEELTGRQYKHLRGLREDYDALMIEKENGFDLPNWADSQLLDRMRTMSIKEFIINVVGAPGMAELAGGPMLVDIIKSINDKHARIMSPDRKLKILLSHDISIMAILGILGIKDFDAPKMASYLVFELHHIHPLDPIVQVLYFNDSSTTDPLLLDLPLCRHPCHLELLTKRVNRVVPSDWKKECTLSSSYIIPSVWLIFIIIIILMHYS